MTNETKNYTTINFFSAEEAAVTKTPRYFVKVVFDNYDMPFNSVDAAYDYIESIDRDLPVLAWSFNDRCWMER